MPRARAQSSPEQKKPKGDCRITPDMQMSTLSPAAKGGFTASGSIREFDLWLRRELGRLHGDVLHEPIPPQLLRALEAAAEPRD